MKRQKSFIAPSAIVGMAENNYIKFADGHVAKVIKREKTKTIRLGEPYLEDGDVAELQTSNGDAFAEAIVKDIEEVVASEIPERDFSGHRNYENFDVFAVEMYEYYKEMIDSDTEFHIISFEVIR